MASISIIVPALNEAPGIRNTLLALQAFRTAGHEVIVVDGGSGDATRQKAEPLADRVLVTAPGRARQMNAGAAVAVGDVLWFLHADTRCEADAALAILECLADPQRVWGRFDVRLSGTHPTLRIIERAMNLRSRLTRIATGDQGIFVRRRRFERIGGFPEQPIMEDIALSRALRCIAPPCCLRSRLTTSSRRWERYGVFRTVLLMWRLRLAYFIGVDPRSLARSYR